MISGGGKSRCIAAIGGAIGLFAWSLSVPLTGGISLVLALQGASLTAGTIAAIMDCAEK